MYRLTSLLFLSAIAASCAATGFRTNNPVSAVDPFIGTDGIVHTFPGAAAPFGMIQLSPDGDISGWNWCSGYHASDSSIMGFSHNHLSGTGWSDLGDILIMATSGPLQLTAGTRLNPDLGYRSRIAHDTVNEKASPGYYMVNLLDYDVRAELSASSRVGYHKYTFARPDTANIIINPAHKIFGQIFDTEVSIINDSTVNGWCSSTGWGGERTVWFVAKFSRPFDIAQGGKLGYVRFTDASMPVEIQVALSHVSQNGAMANLAAETNQSFSQARAATSKSWNERLKNFNFNAVSPAQLRMLYTGLYHAFLQPNLGMDVDSQYVAGGASRTSKLSGDIYKAADFTNYSTFSFWDTFRAANQLLTITDHETLANIIKSLISRYENGGHLPLWELLGYDNTCMIGYPSVAIIGDAIMKDIPGFDYNRAFDAMRDAAFNPYISSSDGDSGIPEYIALGYVPAEIPISVSKTLEYSYYDWVIAQVATKLGRIEDAKLFTARSKNFLNLWRADKKLMWPKNKEGQWVDQNLRSWESLKKHYISGNIYSYSYFYPHAVDTMITLYGGGKNYVKALDDLLSMPLMMEGEQHLDISGFVGHYAHGDEPGHQFLYLFNMAGAPSKAAPWIHRVSDDYYNDSRNGMPNNDDCGQMSSWYIFSAMGFYPVCPGDNKYYIGSPMMHSAQIKTATGNTFKMTAQNYSSSNIYIQSTKLNGKPLNRGYITHKEIMDGATLEFIMGPDPVN